MIQRLRHVQGVLLVILAIGVCVFASVGIAAEPVPNDASQSVETEPAQQDRDDRSGLAWDFWFPREALNERDGLEASGATAERMGVTPFMSLANRM